MIVTKEQQEAMLEKYIKMEHNTDECSGFIDGINATIELIDKLFTSNVIVQIEPSGRKKYQEELIKKIMKGDEDLGLYEQ